MFDKIKSTDSTVAHLPIPSEKILALKKELQELLDKSLFKGLSTIELSKDNAAVILFYKYSHRYVNKTNAYPDLFYHFILKTEKLGESYGIEVNHEADNGYR